MSLAGEKEFKMGITYCVHSSSVKTVLSNWRRQTGLSVVVSVMELSSLNYEAPTMVVNLFQDIPGQIKTITKIVTFQEKQKQSIRNHLSEKKKRLRSRIIEQDLKISKLKRLLEEKKLKLETLKQESSFHKATLDSIAAPLNNPNPTKELRVSWKEDSSLDRKLAENPGLCVHSRKRFRGSRIEEQTLGTSVRGKDLEYWSYILPD